MNSFDFELLLLPSLIIFISTLAVSLLVLKSPANSIITAILKTLFFFIYFSTFFDGTFTFSDDWEYIFGGEILLKEWSNDPQLLYTLAGGSHWVYFSFNAFAFKLFGVYYFSPVACNIILTVFISYFGAILARNAFKFSVFKYRFFYVFLLFHPNILFWSSITNLKDILVLFLHVVLLWSVFLFYEKRFLRAFILALSSSLVFFFLRFYVPLMISVAFLISIFFVRSLKKHRLHFIILGGILVSLLLLRIGPKGIDYALNVIRQNLVNPLYGIIRFTLTPIPFGTVESYAFLDLPALFHWVFLFFAFIGAVKLIRKKSDFSSFVLVYIAVFSLLYSVLGELQGPRHRVQLDYAWALLQYLGFYGIIKGSVHTFKKHHRE